MDHKAHSTILLAAGTGSRFGGDVPKQWTKLCGRYVVEIALERFAQDQIMQQLVLVVAAPWLDTAKSLLHHLGLEDRNRFIVTTGGDSREASTNAGLNALDPARTKFVLIHDAARPLVNPAVNQRVLAALDKGATSVVPVIPVADTLKRRQDGSTANRDDFALAQTPQGFDFELIKKAHNAGLVATDDCALMEQTGHKPTLVDGAPSLHKITTQADKLFVEAMMAGGMGIDD